MVTLESKFGFGKYKGLTIKDVWTGPASNCNHVIKEYFVQLFEFIKTNYRQSTSFIIPHDYLQLEDLSKTRSSEASEKFEDFRVVVSDKYLVIEADDVRTVRRVNNELRKIYRGRLDIIPINKLTKGGQGRETILSECLRISADPHYILWCIKTVDRFSIDQEEFEKMQLLDSHILERITIKEIRTDLLEYEPIYKVSRIQINEDIDKINAKKIELINEVRERRTYGREDRESRTFGEYSGSYAQDVMGYSDEEIDDIFDGDPDAYWNID